MKKDSIKYLLLGAVFGVLVLFLLGADGNSSNTRYTAHIIALNPAEIIETRGGSPYERNSGNAGFWGIILDTQTGSYVNLRDPELKVKKPFEKVK